MSHYQTLLERVKKTAELYPENNALALNEVKISYKNLIEYSEKWAKIILFNAKKPKLDRVAVFSYKSIGGYLGTLAALMTGGAFVPLNPRLPTIRNISILSQCKPDAIIVDKFSMPELIKISKQIKLPVILFSDGELCRVLDDTLSEFGSDSENFDSLIELPNITENDDAYILFTSGSAGEPKGVPIKHRNVCSFLMYNQSRYSITPKDRLSQTFDQTFDLSVFDLFMAWFHGACLCIMRPIDLISPEKYINDNKITVWFSVPSVVALLKKQGFLRKNLFPMLRLSLFCGEPLLEDYISSWADAAPNSICENLYGPTELTIACSAYRWQRNEKNPTYNQVLSIGLLYPHMTFLLLDENKNISKDEGELCVSGVQMFEGYLPSQGNTTAVDPFIHIKDEYGRSRKYYCTGDRVRLDKSGNIIYLGRLDQQVKINGYRVELSEIESTLSKINAVERVIVFSFEKEDRSLKLVAYIVGDITPADVLEFARKTLPSYMVPEHIEVAKNLPLNNNGKIDRKAIKSEFLSRMN